ncbi:hypothetical protein [Bosea sp. FBZP-16]|uniref:hypothetical protein n=1 Tax=Bosea sp. FBZP-16 TaxID=2065382 RepID=UPI000C30824B|nr:hypothetical protein [Bosea sp. FBZP-16]
MSNNPRREGRRSFERGYATNPYTITYNREEWQRGYEEASREFDAAQAAQAAEDERWRYMPPSCRALDDLEQAVGAIAAEKIKALVEAMLAER